MRRRFDLSGKIAACVLATTVVSTLISGCGDDPVTIAGFSVTIGTPTTVVGNSNILCVPFTATGSGSTPFSVLLEYALASAPGSFFTATEISSATPGASALTSNSSGNLSNGTFTGVFYWDVPANLGPFGGASGTVRFASGGSVVSTNNAAFSYAPSLPVPGAASGSATPGSSSGAPTSGGSGRAAHGDFSPGGTNVVIDGGRNNAPTNNAFSSVDRFNINFGTLTYSSTSFQMTGGRTDHASSFFLDPTTNALRLLVTGGAPHGASSTATVDTANVYAFTPVEQIITTANVMSVARRGHTATWAPNNRVYIIGGETTPGSATTSIEQFEPESNMFTTPLFSQSNPLLSFARRGHTATLLPNGRILIAGGFDPASPTTPLPAELFDPSTNQMVPFTSSQLSSLDFVDHTATRLSNGWVLLTGGRSVSNPASYISSATLFFPELGATGDFTTTAPIMASARALHAAVLLGNGSVLVTGGETAVNTPTTGAELFLPSILAFSSVTPLATPRAEHSSTALANGTVVVVAGRNGSNFLDTVEMFPANNAVPTISAGGLTVAATEGQSSTQATISLTATDADGDGGYVILRARDAGTTNAWSIVRLLAGSPGSNGRLMPGANSYTWDFITQFPNGANVEVQAIPVGSVFGTPVTFNATLP
jgi:hypothetical protein